MYTFDSYAEFFKEGPKRKVMIAVGGSLYVILISLIHILFWILVLPTGEGVFPFSFLFILLQTVISIGYIFLYRTAKSMWPLGIIHVMLNISGVLLSGNSILPFLIIV
jgi:predicted Abi (CAAX) family protease